MTHAFNQFKKNDVRIPSKMVLDRFIEKKYLGYGLDIIRICIITETLK